MIEHDALLALHNRIDAEAERLTRLHGHRMMCRRGCSDCCDDELTVFVIEAERIRREFGELLATAEPHSPGRCAFLDRAGACRIYTARPYVCRTQGLPLRYLAEDEDGEVFEVRDICPLNLEGESLELVDESNCWTLGVVEDELARIQFEAFGDYARIELRALFAAR